MTTFSKLTVSIPFIFLQLKRGKHRNVYILGVSPYIWIYLRIVSSLDKDKIFAIGEVGIDLKEPKELEKQTQIFEKVIKLAMKIDKPLIVHSRKAEEECIQTLERLKARKVIMHCFSGNMNLVKQIVGNGWFLSIPANVKYSEHFQNIAKLVSLDNLFCETDSPYLHPEKKENNEPVNVIESYMKISEINDISLEEVKEKIWNNYLRIK